MLSTGDEMSTIRKASQRAQLQRVAVRFFMMHSVQHPCTSSHPNGLDALSLLGASYTSRLLEQLGRLAGPAVSLEIIEQEKKLVALEVLALIMRASTHEMVEAPQQPCPSVQLTVDEVGALFDAACGES
jgi:hypothetical protein